MAASDLYRPWAGPAISTWYFPILTLCVLAAVLSTQGIAYANSLDPDQAQQNIGLAWEFIAQKYPSMQSLQFSFIVNAS